jgi:hypothetical protein
MSAPFFFATYTGDFCPKPQTVMAISWAGAGAQEALFRYLAKGRKAGKCAR